MFAFLIAPPAIPDTFIVFNGWMFSFDKTIRGVPTGFVARSMFNNPQP